MYRDVATFEASTYLQIARSTKDWLINFPKFDVKSIQFVFVEGYWFCFIYFVGDM